MNKWPALLAVAFLTIFSACKTSKKIPQPDYKDPLESHDYYKAKGKIVIENAGSSQKATVNIRLKKDSLLWISVVNKVEAARILISNDSIKFLNRLDKKYYSNSLDSMGRLFSFSFDFELIQNILTSRTPTNSKIKWSKGATDLIGTEKRTNWLLTYILDSEKKNLKKLEINEIQGGNNLSIDYSGAIAFEDGAIANQLKSFAKFSGKRAKGSINLTFTYDKFNFASKEEVGFPFRIPDKYGKL